LRRLLGLVVVVAIVSAGVAQVAGAVTWSNPCSLDLDVATCERLTQLYEQTEAQRQEQGWIVGALLVVAITPLFMRTFRH
jgi:hypothetical protein